MDTNKLPKTVTATIGIYLTEYTREVVVSTSDMTKHGWSLLGSQEVTFEVPEHDPAALEIRRLKDQAAAIKAAANHNEAELARIKSQLADLEHDGGEG